LGLTGSETFLYGALGASGSLVVVQAIPWGLRLMRGADFHFSPTRLLGAIIVIVGYLVMGGLVATAVGGADAPRHAIAYGLGWQGLIGGFLQTRLPR
jgi:uncharacterized membrane protein YbjE (DUF340 family)